MTNDNLLSAKSGFYFNLKAQDSPSGATGYVLYKRTKEMVGKYIILRIIVTIYILKLIQNQLVG